jgi:hypothetical protein
VPFKAASGQNRGQKSVQVSACMHECMPQKVAVVHADWVQNLRAPSRNHERDQQRPKTLPQVIQHCLQRQRYSPNLWLIHIQENGPVCDRPPYLHACFTDVTNANNS